MVILSGEYEIARDKYKDVEIEVYYNKKHPWNIQRMVKGVKNSLRYCSSNFKEYPYSTFRVVEIPDYIGGGARSQPSLVYWREGAGFISNIEDSEGIDQVYGITSHETAHNWWPGIVIPAHAEGIALLSESLAQYVRSLETENEYGRKMFHKHLKKELDNYLKRRKRDNVGERPMMRARSSQHYLSYEKSTMVMNALTDYIGQDKVNKALRNIIKKFSYKEDDFPTTIDLLREYRAVTPDSLQYIITDLFEKITIYQNKALTANYTKLAEDKYRTSLIVSCRKFYADSIGNQRETTLNDYVYIAVLGENEKELYLKKHKITRQQSEFNIIVDGPPVKAGLDPYLYLIDRDRNDNMVDVDKIE